MKIKISFKLKSTKGKSKIVFLIFNYGYKEFCPEKRKFKYVPLKITTGVSVEKRYWNGSEVKDTHPYHNELNADLARIKITANDVYLQFKLNGVLQPLPSELKEAIEIKLDRKRGGEIKEDWKQNLLLFIDKYIDDQVTLIHNRVDGTIRHYKRFSKKLKSLNRTLNTNWNFSVIDENLYARFFSIIKRDYAQNSVHQFRKHFHKFFKLAQRAGIKNDFIISEAYKNEDYRSPEEITPQVYLNFHQIKQLMDLDLSNNGRLDRVRNGIICQSFTGLRFSDFKQLAKIETELSISGETFEYICIDQTQKTGETAIIPLFPPMKNIYEKYGGNFPNEISSQKYNEYIRELCSDLFTDDFNFWRTVNGKMENDIRQVHTGIASHTFRRSFATNFYNLGVPVKTLMTILTMKKEETFYRYIRNTKKQNAKQMYDMVSKNQSFTQLFSSDSLEYSSTKPSDLAYNNA